MAAIDAAANDSRWKRTVFRFLFNETHSNSPHQSLDTIQIPINKTVSVIIRSLCFNFTSVDHANMKTNEQHNRDNEHCSPSPKLVAECFKCRRQSMWMPMPVCMSGICIFSVFVLPPVSYYILKKMVLNSAYFVSFCVYKPLSDFWTLQLKWYFYVNANICLTVFIPKPISHLFLFISNRTST